MGILDSLTDVANKSTSAVGRTSRSMKLKMRQDELMKRRKDYAAQLGASLYEATREFPAIREGREEIYQMIEQIDEEREQISREIAELEAAQQGSTLYTCSRCGQTVRGDDVYCGGCARPVSEILEEVRRQQGVASSGAASTGSSPVCPVCGEPVAQDDVYCMKCGTRIAESNA